MIIVTKYEKILFVFLILFIILHNFDDKSKRIWIFTIILNL